MATSKRDVSALASGEYEVVIVGGGISGAWLALHCSQAGLRTALIEKSDYASQTSSSSSKLLHGGIRYLQQMQFGKVRESALERAQYLYAAAHLTTPVPFVVPTYRDPARSKWFLNCGMLVYRRLSLGENRLIDSPELALPGSRSISRAQLKEYCDLQDSANTGGVLFYERHMINSERMVLELLQTARLAGAEIHNYVAATDLLKSGTDVCGLRVRDEINGTEFDIKSRLVVNAAGPWIDSLIKSLSTESIKPSISGFAVGSHIITRQLSQYAIALTTQHQSDAKIDRGGRHVFVIPWRGYSLIGTSYDEVDESSPDLSVQAPHVEQLMEAVNHGLPGADLTHDDLVSGYSGLYPLRTDDIQGAIYQGSGEYQIIDHHKSNGVSGLLTALGAKYTTGRKLSELTMRIVAEKLGRDIRIEKQKLHCSDYESVAAFQTLMHQQYGSLLSAETIELLISHYGSQFDGFIESLDDDPQLMQAIVKGQPDILGQIVWAVEREQAINLDDALFRRSSAALLGISDQEVGVAAEVMAEVIGWDQAQLAQQIRQVRQKLAETRRALAGGYIA